MFANGKARTRLKTECPKDWQTGLRVNRVVGFVLMSKDNS